jgi:hypothetical protein
MERKTEGGQSEDPAGHAISVRWGCRSEWELVWRGEEEVRPPIWGRRVPTGSADCHRHRSSAHVTVTCGRIRMDLTATVLWIMRHRSVLNLFYKRCCDPNFHSHPRDNPSSHSQNNSMHSFIMQSLANPLIGNGVSEGKSVSLAVDIACPWEMTTGGPDFVKLVAMYS